VSGWYEDGWPGPLEPRLQALLDHEKARRLLGDAAVESECGPVVEWPAEWGRWSLVACRVAIEQHLAESGSIRAEEARDLGLR